MTQPQLAERAGIPEIIISRLENDAKERRFDTYAPRLASALGLPFVRAWLAEIRTEAQEVRAALDEGAALLDGAENRLGRVEVVQRDLRETAKQAEALSTEIREAKRMFAAELAALETGRQVLDKLSEQVGAIR